MPFQKGNTYGTLRKGHIKSEVTLNRMSNSIKEAHKKGLKFGFQKGHESFKGTEKTRFKKGHKTWNKGLKGFMAGEKNGRWKGGLSRCEKCGKQLRDYISKRCNNCKGEIISIKLKGRKGHPKKGGYSFPKGKEHPNWVGGISKVKKYTRLTAKREWRETREKILKERGEICVRCKKYGNCIDHIIPWRVSKDNNEENLQVLCRGCNSKKMQEDRKKW